MKFSDLRTNHSLQTAQRIVKKMHQPLYLVGGAVRDCVLGKPPGNDIDFVAGVAFDDLVFAFARAVGGKIIAWEFQQKRVAYRLDGDLITVDFAKFKDGSLEADLNNRDFTINALAVSVQDLFENEHPEIIDHCNGLADIEKKTISSCGTNCFCDDPLRILRALRFAQKLNFTIDHSTRSLSCSSVEQLSGVARERVLYELFAILDLQAAGKAVRFLLDDRILTRLLPEIDGMRSIDQPPPHHFDLLEHALGTVDALDRLVDGSAPEIFELPSQVQHYLQETIEGKVTRRALLMFVGLLHDSGKPSSLSYKNGKIIFHGHDQRGAELNQESARSLGLGKRAIRHIGTITANHMRIMQLAQLAKITRRAKIRLVMDCSDCGIEIVLLAVADMLATGPHEYETASGQKILRLAGELLTLVLERENEPEHQALVSGRDLIDILDIHEGPEIGNILKQIRQMERNGTLSTRDDVLQWLQEKKQQH
ncbi:MAG: HD domain-containing protein [Deltaproteobacteria bacterium]|nr:HD domain-containing protein [Deltaproteobacteria bacterium]